ncbi:MAG TPA: cupredoxin domain-containing protein [Pyrinomonadaceae bacterium]|jgi:plastocyanin domain-containing protein
MDTTAWLVLVFGVALMALVVWYFFMGEGLRVAASFSAAGVQQIKVVVKGGYTPDVIVVKRGVPVELDFYRDEVADCTEQVVFGDFGISRRLPAYQTTPVTFTPEQTGEFIFTCGMSMVRGKLIVED